ncbi:hypothetical protein T459_01131 [Capsicum annuum]|uniref:Auxin-responsive protein n=1 Tax=Capsicum annuum TaxID=4072 RepID=A0A2G3AG90_CAPAN|nr:hypothetical protein T459_01131 [Capsicum annuum]
MNRVIPPMNLELWKHKLQSYHAGSKHNPSPHGKHYNTQQTSQYPRVGSRHKSTYPLTSQPTLLRVLGYESSVQQQCNKHNRSSERNSTTHALIITAAATITTACTTIEAEVLLAAPLVVQASNLLPASAVTVQEAVVLDAAVIMQLLDVLVRCICKGIQAFGKAVDLTRLDGYGDLLMKLDMFEIEGELRGSTKKWLVVYTNDEDDMMMVGDNLW